MRLVQIFTRARPICQATRRRPAHCSEVRDYSETVEIGDLEVGPGCPVSRNVVDAVDLGDPYAECLRAINVRPRRDRDAHEFTRRKREAIESQPKDALLWLVAFCHLTR